MEIIELALVSKKVDFSWFFLQNSTGIPRSETNRSKFARPLIVFCSFVFFVLLAEPIWGLDPTNYAIKEACAFHGKTGVFPGPLVAARKTLRHMHYF